MIYQNSSALPRPRGLTVTSRSIAAVLLLMQVASLSGCGSQTSEQVSVSLNATAATLEVATTMIVRANVIGAATDALTWSSSNTAILTVSGRGDSAVVSAIAPGVATVQVQVRGFVAKYEVTVVPRQVARTVVLGNGAMGEPTAGFTTIRSGSLIQWSYSVRPGYSNLHVWINDSLVGATGSVTANTPITIRVLADSVAPIEAQAAQMAVARNAIFSAIASGNPLDAYREIQTAVRNLERESPNTPAAAFLQAAMSSGASPAAVAQSLAKISNAVLDSLYRASITTNGAAISRANAAPFHTVVRFVNGVNTTPWDVETSVPKLLSLADMAGLQDRTKYLITSFYNRTQQYQQSLNKWSCMVSAGMSAAFAPASAIDNYAACFGVSVLADLSEASQQTINSLLGTFPSQAAEDASQLAGTIMGDLGNGSRVILVAHSQGNLMVREALDLLRKSGSQTDLRCVGVLSIAPPVQVPANGNGPSVTSMIVDDRSVQDILKIVNPLNAATPVSNALSGELNGKYPILNFFSFLSPVSTANLVLRVADGIKVHGVVESYFESAGTKEKVVEGLRVQAAQVEGNCGGQLSSVSVQPSSVTLAIGLTRSLSAELKNSANQLLQGRTVTWTSSNNAVASVSSEGLVTAKTPGTAIVTATSGAVSGQATIMVPQPNEPEVTTAAPSELTVTSFRMNGTVDPRGNANVTVWFERFASSNCSGTAQSLAVADAGGSGASSRSIVWSAALPGTTYSYRLVAQRSGGSAQRANCVTATTISAAIDFSFSASALSISPGGTASTSLAILRTNFSGNVSISVVTSLPAGLTATPTQPGAGSAGSILFSLNTNHAVFSSIPVIIRVSGSGVATVDRTLTISLSNNGAIAMSLSPAALTISAGSSASTTVSLTRTNFAGSLNLSVPTSLPAGVTATITSPGTSNSGSVQFSMGTSHENFSSVEVVIRASGVGIAPVDAVVTISLANQARVLSVLSGANQQGIVSRPLAQPVAVKLATANGTPLSGVLVNFAVFSGGGSISGSSVYSNADGVAQVNWTLGSVVGSQSLRVSSQSATSLTIGAVASTPPASVSEIQVTPRTITLAVGQSASLTAQVVQPSGAPFATVSFASLAPSVAIVDQQGRVSGISAGVATITITATAPGTSLFSASQVLTAATVTVTAAPQSIMITNITSPNGQPVDITNATGLATIAVRLGTLARVDSIVIYERYGANLIAGARLAIPNGTITNLNQTVSWGICTNSYIGNQFTLVPYVWTTSASGVAQAIAGSATGSIRRGACP